MGVVDALLGVSMAGGLGSGNVLVCTEGLPPPVPRNIGSMTSDMKTDRYVQWRPQIHVQYK